VIYNEEDDQHFPVMTVYQTLEFALLNKTKKSEKENIPIIINALLKMFGISHAAHTGKFPGESERDWEMKLMYTHSCRKCIHSGCIRRRAKTGLHCGNTRDKVRRHLLG